MPTINELNAVTTPSGSDLLPVYSQANGDARKLSLTNLASWLDSLSPAGGSLTQYSNTTNGSTVTVTNSGDSVWLIMTPVATIAGCTVKLPETSVSVDQQQVLVSATNEVTTLTINGNGSTVSGAPTTIAAGGYFRLQFDAVTSTWYRVG